MMETHQRISSIKRIHRTCSKNLEPVTACGDVMGVCKEKQAGVNISNDGGRGSGFPKERPAVMGGDPGPTQHRPSYPYAVLRPRSPPLKAAARCKLVHDETAAAGGAVGLVVNEGLVGVGPPAGFVAEKVRRADDRKPCSARGVGIAPVTSQSPALHSSLSQSRGVIEASQAGLQRTARRLSGNPA